MCLFNAFESCSVLHLFPAMLPSYSLYLACFKTTKHKTKREYVGITLDAADRERALRGNVYKQPWLGAGIEDLDMLSVLEHIPGKQAALALEALCTAQRMMSRRMGTCRGGPWVLPSLGEQDELEVRDVSRCKSLPEVFELVDKYPSGRLAFHLKDLRYKPQTGHPLVMKSATSMKALPMKALSMKALPMKSRPMKASPMQQVRAAPVKLSRLVFRRCKVDVLKISKIRISGVRKSGSKPKETGAARRSRLGLTGEVFLKDKYGNFVNETRNKALRTWRQRQPLKKPAAAGQ